MKKRRRCATVESGVLLVERSIIAALRNRKFFSIEELNQAIRELRGRINQRPFRKREGSRATQFAAVDKPALSPLPAERFDLSEWFRARLNIDITPNACVEEIDYRTARGLDKSVIRSLTQQYA
jgi:hypothetical protein